MEENTCDSSNIGNPSWADAMQKILRGSKEPLDKLLTKAKKDSEIDLTETKKKNEFEVVDDEENVLKIDDENEEKIVVKDKRSIKRKDQNWELVIRLKPNINEKEREKALARIATKGVVQLFNAVKQQQVTVSDKLKKSGTERKREKVMKNISKGDFLDLLHGRSKSINVKDEMKSKKFKEDKGPSWELFRDDFMLGAKMKDWDKPSEEMDIL